MVTKEQERVKQLLSDTVKLLCRNGLTYNTKFSISALIGITLDDNDVVLVEIRETFTNTGGDEETDNSDRVSYQSKSSSRKRNKPHRHSRQHSVVLDEDNGTKSDPEQNLVGSSFPNPVGPDKIKREQAAEYDSDEDLVFIKDEPGVSGGDMSTPASSENIGRPSTSATSMLQSNSQQQSSRGAGLQNSKELSHQAAGSSMQGQSSHAPKMDGKRYCCDHCPLTFSEFWNMHFHVRSKHLGIFLHPCPECPRGFNGKGDLHGHLASAHGHQEYLLQCPHCPQKFTYKHTLTRHSKAIHDELYSKDKKE